MDRNILEIEKIPKLTIRAEMKRRDISTKKICFLLKNDFGLHIEEASFNNKISRSSFNAVFFFQCMYVLGVSTIKCNIKTK